MARQKFQQSFLHILSHQLRTPVYSIRDALDLLHHRARKFPGDSKNIVEIARRKCNQLAKLLEDLLKITDTRMGQVVSKSHRPVHLNNLIEDVIKNNSIECYKKEISVRTDLYNGRQKFYLSSNKELLEQVLQNLILNAIKYSKSKSTVWIKTKYLKSLLEISVTDKGPGIPQKEQSLIFTPFYRLATTIPKNPDGTGLGLSIAKLFANKMDAKIGVKSKRGKGSKFWVKLPTKRNGGSHYFIGGG